MREPYPLPADERPPELPPWDQLSGGVCSALIEYTRGVVATLPGEWDVYGLSAETYEAAVACYASSLRHGVWPLGLPPADVWSYVTGSYDQLLTAGALQALGGAS